MAKKNFIIDTSVFLSDSGCIYKFQNNDIFIPLKVLEEIDKHKKRQDTVGHHARQAIRSFDSLRAAGSLSKGVRIAKGLGVLRVIKASEICLNELPSDLTHQMSDHLILATALTIKKEYPKRKAVVVSRDINMRVIADSLGLLTEDYSNTQVVDNSDKIYEGFAKLLVDEELVNHFYLGNEVYVEEELCLEQNIKLYPNEFVMLVSSSNEKKTALCRFTDHLKPLKHIRDMKNELMWGIYPRNKEQSFAFDLLFDDEIPLVSLIGKAGSGKTLMAIAAALEQGLGGKGDQYRRIIISRPVQPLGKDIGFLPGTLEDKMLPWLKPIQDNIRHLMGDDRTMLEAFVEKGKIEDKIRDSEVEGAAEAAAGGGEEGGGGEEPAGGEEEAGGDLFAADMTDGPLLTARPGLGNDPEEEELEECSCLDDTNTEIIANFCFVPGSSVLNTTIG